MKRMTSALAMACFCGFVFAEDEAPEGWSGTGQLGFVKTTGNTETESVNAQLDLQYDHEKWQHSLRVRAVSASDSGDTTAERYELGAKTEYRYRELDYWFGALRHDDDRFSSFDYQTTLTAGYGRDMISNDRHQLSGEIGAGFRTAKIAATGETQDNFIGRGFLDYKWQLTENTKFTNTLLIEAGEDNTFAENNAGLQVQMNSSLALKLAYTVRRNSDVAPGVEKTDTITGVNLVYDF